MDKKLFEQALEFHGHKCPAMPLGLRAAELAMNKLGVERAKDKELHVISETGKGHAAGCFLDGIMVATGCTYGKANIEKKYLNKLAFTLIDVKKQKAVRVRVKDDFLEKMMQSPFLEERKKGIPPQDVAPEIVDPLVNNVLNMPYEKFLELGNIQDYKFTRKKGTFRTKICEDCGERVFVMD